MIRRPPRSTQSRSSAASDVYKRQTPFLVPDPVYVPLQATPADLMNGLVYDLVKPQKDWLSGGATRTAFPAGTTFPAGPTSIGAVTIEGVTAVVNLGGCLTT